MATVNAVPVYLVYAMAADQVNTVPVDLLNAMAVVLVKAVVVSQTVSAFFHGGLIRLLVGCARSHFYIPIE